MRAADSSSVGGRGGGGEAGAGRMARTAACFCVVLTLETAAAFFGAALRVAGFGAGFLALAEVFGLVAVFFAAVFTDLRATGLAAAAL